MKTNFFELLPNPQERLPDNLNPDTIVKQLINDICKRYGNQIVGKFFTNDKVDNIDVTSIFYLFSEKYERYLIKNN